ncbi:DUF3667 domain-containing protein [Aureibaculum sp. A20]|uniref:DUF3667 domain-containing protein n=1 Tax=Aureibaculum flavum TaxID=2795986 RepID=A0ABS0WSC3_9FLAO|nr:DUF3667 domain-containing protein [Aureibaculum flavum]MBJ2174885.1 DUF3667 domain-containing protein [Aureibaculum flavum]
MKSTTRFSKNIRGIECLNCKQPLSDSDNFCSNCGQVNDLQPLSVKQFFSEFFSGFFSFDSRFFRTFIPLVFKPGKVSKSYIEGKRMQYANPFRLYLNVTIVFFLLQSLFSVVDKYTLNEFSSENSNNIISVKDSTHTNTTPADSIIKDLPIFKSNENSSNDLTKNLLLRIDSIFTSTNLLQQLKTDSNLKIVKDSIYKDFFNSNNNYISEQINKAVENNNWNVFQSMSTLDKDTYKHVEQIFKENEIDYSIPEEYKSQTEADINKIDFFKKLNKFSKYDNAHPNGTALSAMEELGVAKTRFNAFYYKLAQNYNKLQDDPTFRQSYVNSIISKISIALFFLLPIFTLVLSLLYIRHKWNYTEHLIFVFNVQTVFFLLLLVFIIIDRIVNTNTKIYLFVPLFLFYLFKALHNFYGQYKTKTFVKFILLNFFYYLLASLGLIAVSFIAFIL